MLGQVDAPHINPQDLGDFLHWPLFRDVKIKYLEMSGTNLAFHFFNCLIQKTLLPFLLPYVLQDEAAWVRYPFG